MADVNPNQDLRFKEIMRRLVPGGYALVFMQITHGFTGNGNNDIIFRLASSVNGVEDVKSGLLYSLIVVIAYIIGFLNNTIASSIERFCYKMEVLSRPSRMVLTKSSKYRMENSEKVVSKSGVEVFCGNVCQEQAARILRIAKCSIKRKDNVVEEMFHQSIMARNLLCVHILSVIIVAINYVNNFSWMSFTIASLIIGMLFWKEWRRKNIIYVRNVFEEYLKNDI